MKQVRTAKSNLGRIRDETLENYITNISTMNKSTAHEYLFRLNNFRTFITNHSNSAGLDDVIAQINEKQKILTTYLTYTVHIWLQLTSLRHISRIALLQ